jgi:WD40 repeat protein
MPIYSIDWSPCNEYIATAGGDNSISVSRSSSNSSLGNDQQELCSESVMSDAHSNGISCVRWNPIDKFSHYLASTADDGLLKLWVLDV